MKKYINHQKSINHLVYYPTCQANAKFFSLLFLLLMFLAVFNVTAFGTDGKAIPEKAYLHLDKPLYYPGEDIWFKVYLLNAMTNEPSLISEMIYVELIAPNGNTVQKLKLPVINGLGKGNFTLKEQASGGLYRIRSYTMWQKNFGDAYLFEKKIQIQNFILPKLLLHAELSRKAYGPGDKVSAEFDLKDLENKPIAFTQAAFTVKVDNEIVLTDEITTNADGKAIISFQLPKQIKKPDGIINIIARHRGQTESLTKTIPINLNDIDLQFMPEGGAMIMGLETFVGFKAINSTGKPVDVEGVILDAEGKQITSFKSHHDGMGKVKLTVDKQAYFAQITNPAHVNEIYPLPIPIEHGLVMNARVTEMQGIQIRIQSSANQKCILLGKMHGREVFRKMITVNKTSEINIPCSDFLAGVIQLQLLDLAETVQCERLCFINGQKTMQVQINPAKAKFIPREQVEVQIKTMDEKGKPIPANISIAAINQKLLTHANDKSDNILSYFLVSSEINGEIHEPAFYFNKKHFDSAQIALDNLLLTQGWKNYQWDRSMPENFSVQYVPEKSTTVFGVLKHKKTGAPIQGEITLIEFSYNKRAAIVKTNENGEFAFFNTNPFTTQYLLAKSDDYKPELLSIEISMGSKSKTQNQYGQLGETEFLPLILKESPIEDKPEISTSKSVTTLFEDISSLDEVVVIGYGTQKKSDLTGSVVVVNAESLTTLSIENALQGRVAGVDVVNENGNPGSGKRVSIRGISTINGNEPMVIVDGLPMVRRGNYFLPPHINSGDIESITVLKDAAAAAIYGSQAANGVVIINTNKHYYFTSKEKRHSRNYQVLKLAGTQFDGVKEFYAPHYTSSDTVRNDFRTTIYWNADVQTNIDGLAKVEFSTSDEITSFKIIAEGIGANKLIGMADTNINNQLPIYTDIKMPNYYTEGDEISIPVVINNQSKKPVSGKLQIEISGGIKLAENFNRSIQIDSDSFKKIELTGTALPEFGQHQIKISFIAGQNSDKFTQDFEVLPLGFPTEISLSGREPETTFSFDIVDPQKGSLTATFKAFPSITNELVAGLEGMIRAPYGCFEQTSSITYPNIMILQYLKNKNIANPALEKKALGYIEQGYKRLIGFETSQGGFEWFGKTPPHEALTAYGVLEFTEMKEVYSGVDEKMLNRTTDWLLSRRDGNGNFKLHPMSLDRFGRASQKVTNAYILYALTEAGIKQLNTEFETAYNEVIESQDPYRLALLINSAFNMNEKKQAENLIRLFNKKLKEKPFSELEIDHSITRSYGISLKIETAALYLMGALKSEEPDLKKVKEIAELITSFKSFGSYGSTQATVLALKALIELDKFTSTYIGNGEVWVKINNAPTITAGFSNESDLITIKDLEQYLNKGKNTVQVEFKKKDYAIPYSLDIEYNSLTPASDSASPTTLNCTLSEGAIGIGETVRLTAILKNKTKDGLPMTMAIVGIPGGLDLQSHQLKELQENNTFDYYEIIENYLVMYYRQMLPQETRTINLDLKAIAKGKYTGSASCSYLYYTSELKHWDEGLTIEVR